MDAQIFKFFPLLVYRSNIFLPEKEKNILIEEIRNMKQNSKNLREQSNFDAWTGDVRGYELLHKNQKFNKLSLKSSLEKGTEMSSKVIQQIGARL